MNLFAASLNTIIVYQFKGSLGGCILNQIQSNTFRAIDLVTEHVFKIQ